MQPSPTKKPYAPVEKVELGIRGSLNLQAQRSLAEGTTERILQRASSVRRGES